MNIHIQVMNKVNNKFYTYSFAIMKDFLKDAAQYWSLLIYAFKMISGEAKQKHPNILISYIQQKLICLSSNLFPLYTHYYQLAFNTHLTIIFPQSLCEISTFIFK